MTTRIAALCSGGGSNLQAIMDFLDAPERAAKARVALVASDRATAGALERARARGIPAVAMDTTRRTTGLLPMLEEHAIDLVVLAGYLRMIPADVVAAYRGRMMNVHPALLPAFGGAGLYGHHVHDAVVAAGVRVTGATVQFVNDEYDRGPIIVQWPVPVLAGDTADAVARRVLAVEHRIFPAAVLAVAEGRVSLGADGHVHGDVGLGTGERFALE
jgi:formyltetrahydrofolate-dependent phosphoribosylglycinamide formyltransferase